MPHLNSLLLLILFTGSLFGGEKAAPSEEMKQILRDRQVGQHDLQLKGLTKLNWTPAKLEEFQKKVPMEVYHVPPPKRTADYFAYTIYRIESDNRFLIVRSGGIVGISQVYASFQQ